MGEIMDKIYLTTIGNGHPDIARAADQLIKDSGYDLLPFCYGYSPIDAGLVITCSCGVVFHLDEGWSFADIQETAEMWEGVKSYKDEDGRPYLKCSATL